MRKGGYFVALPHRPRPKERREKEGERPWQRARGGRGREREREGERVKMWRWEDVMTMWRWEDVKVWWRCEHMKLYSRPPLLEEAFAQTLSGKRDRGRQNVSGHRGTAGDSTHCVIWQTNLEEYYHPCPLYWGDVFAVAMNAIGPLPLQTAPEEYGECQAQNAPVWLEIKFLGKADACSNVHCPSAT